MRLLDRYKNDICGLLRDLNYNREILYSWSERLKEITEITGASLGSSPSRGNMSDKVGRIAAERIGLKDKIKEYDRDIIAIERALASLTDEEFKVINALCINKDGVYSVCEALNFSRSKIYEIRAAALDKLNFQIYG